MTGGTIARILRAMRLILYRHGPTDWTDAGQVQGREDVPLNDRGREAVARSAETLRGEGISFFAASPLSRAWESAYILATALGVAGIMRSSDLVECDFGSLSGVDFREFDRLAGPRNRGSWPDPLDYDFRPFGGECAWDVLKRQLETVRILRKRYQGETVCLVGHSRSLRTLAGMSGMHHIPRLAHCEWMAIRPF